MLDSPEGVLWEEVGDDDTTTPVVGRVIVVMDWEMVN